MKKRELGQVATHLRKILVILSSSNAEDSWIRKAYAEYLVASELAKRGYTVQIATERDVSSADIFLSDIQKRVEVKSGVYESDEYGVETAASFGKGTQITKGKFDYCVFVTFDKNDVDKTFIFRREELKEVGKPRISIAGFPDTNPCLLLFYKRYRDYLSFAKAYPKDRFQIEDDLNKNPRKYQDRWSIIRT